MTIKHITKHDKKKLAINLGLLITIWQLGLAPALAAADNGQIFTTTTPGLLLNESSAEETEENEADEKPATVLTFKSLGVKGISAYNAGDPYQTDGNPCRSANGENICLALELGYKRCASNMVPFGTLLEIEGYGRCLVTDRMNSRFQNHVDIAMKASEKQAALQFGRRKLAVTIVKVAKAE